MVAEKVKLNIEKSYAENIFIADKWELSKLGNEAEIESLEPFTAESPTDRYELTNNELKIMANKKDRSMMGIVTCK